MGVIMIEIGENRKKSKVSKLSIVYFYFAWVLLVVIIVQRNANAQKMGGGETNRWGRSNLNTIVVTLYVCVCAAMTIYSVITILSIFAQFN